MKNLTREPVIQGTISAAMPKTSARDRTRQASEVDKLSLAHVMESPDYEPMAKKNRPAL